VLIRTRFWLSTRPSIEGVGSFPHGASLAYNVAKT
jgi:hypothetical protein